MVQVNKSIYYYLILFATFIFTFSLIPIVFQTIQLKNTSNIPYISLISIIFGFIIYLYIAVSRGYIIHIFLYTIGLLSVSMILFLKYKFDNNSIVINTIEQEN